MSRLTHPVADPAGHATNGTAADPAADVLLLDARQVGQLLGCSARHVVRLADAGQLPPPIKVGRLVRWSRAALEAWIAAQTKPQAE